uniref:holo-ACP synthase n=1 Tax=Castellaniella defragrans TaxID=75697 RepID=UPI003340CC8D
MLTPGIAGIGTDLLRIERMERAYVRHGERLLKRILGPEEQAVFRRRAARDPQRGIRYLATRFAAKEAFSKAIGLGMHMPMTWSRMQVVNLPGGRPSVRLSGPLADWYGARFGQAHISLADEHDMATAFVVIEALPAKTEMRKS